MEDLPVKVAFCEARLTLLERQFTRFINEAPPSLEKPAETIVLSCSEPGLMISRMYAAEEDKTGRQFCWVGNDGPIQIVLPVIPTFRLACTLHFQPHPKVDFGTLSLVVNDNNVSASTSSPARNMKDVSFKVARSGATCLSVLLLGVVSVRPSDFGENNDKRLLAARFYGATVAFE